MPIEFFYEFASTYSYLAAARIEALAADAGVTVVWRPFLLGPVFAAQGWNDSPFNIYETKGRYMWRDMERLCASYGLPFARPSRFPRNGLHAARVALIAADAGFCGEFTRAVYRANFADDREISEFDVLSRILNDLGRDAAAILERAGQSENKERLRTQTEEAVRRGAFGAPSFFVGDELFWGNDRLEQAIEWAKRK